MATIPDLVTASEGLLDTFDEADRVALNDCWSKLAQATADSILDESFPRFYITVAYNMISDYRNGRRDDELLSRTIEFIDVRIAMEDAIIKAGGYEQDLEAGVAEENDYIPPEFLVMESWSEDSLGEARIRQDIVDQLNSMLNAEPAASGHRFEVLDSEGRPCSFQLDPGAPFIRNLSGYGNRYVRTFNKADRAKVRMLFRPKPSSR